MSDTQTFREMVSDLYPPGDNGPKRCSQVAVEGLVHISELSWDKVRRPSNVVSEGDKAKVKVIGTDTGRLALSKKQAQEDPWTKVAKKYKKDIGPKDFQLFALDFIEAKMDKTGHSGGLFSKLFGK